jgi:hypothetical protein
VIDPAVAAVLVPLTALAGLFATARLTRLIAADRILLPVRGAIVRRFGPSSALGYLVHCRWCVSIWLSIPVAAGVLWLWLLLLPRMADDLPWPARVLLAALLALTFSHGTALLAGLEDED